MQKKIKKKKRRENYKKGFHLSTIVFALMVRFFMGNLALEGLTHEKNKLAKGNKGGDSLFACWGIFRDLAHPLKWGKGLMGETRLSLFSLFSWWVPLLIFLFWIDQTQDHNSLFPCFNIFWYIYLYIFIFSTNPCSNYLKSWGAWIFLVLFSYFTERHHMVMGQGDVRCSLVSSTPLITS